MKIYMDVMLDYKQMRWMSHESRKKEILDRLTKEIPEVVLKYSIEDFDRTRFLSDVKHWIESRQLH